MSYLVISELGCLKQLLSTLQDVLHHIGAPRNQRELLGHSCRHDAYERCQILHVASLPFKIRHVGFASDDLGAVGQVHEVVFLSQLFGLRYVGFWLVTEDYGTLLGFVENSFFSSQGLGQVGGW